MSRNIILQTMMFLAGAVFLSLCSQVSAQCSLTDTYESCVESRASNSETLTAETQSRQASELASSNTGSGDSDTTSDLASKIRLTLDETNFGDNGQTLPTISWSGILKDALLATFFDEDDLAKFGTSDHKLTFKLNEPELFSELDAILSDTQKNDLSGNFEDWDDITYSFTWSPVSQRYGRRLSEHSTEFGILTNSIIDKGNQELALISNSYRDIFILPFTALSNYDRRIDIPSLTFEEFISICDLPISQNAGQETTVCDSTLLESARNTMANVQHTKTAILNSVERRLNSPLIQGFRKLVENQPQWIVELSHRNRDELAGRNESNLKIGYEWSKYNVNWLNDSCRNDRDKYGCFSSSIADNSAVIERGARFGFSLEYSDKDKYSFVRAGLPQLMLNRENSLIANAAFSRTVNLGRHLPIELGAELARMELSASYEDVSNDPMRNDRAIGKLTFSQEISEGRFMTFGFVYSSRPEYLSDVDEKLSARLGVNFKFGK